MSTRTRRFLPHFHIKLCVEWVFSERRHGAYCLEAIRLKVRGGGYTAPQSLDAGGRSPPSLLASARLIHFFYNLTHLQLAPFLHSSSLPLTKKGASYLYTYTFPLTPSLIISTLSLLLFVIKHNTKHKKRSKPPSSTSSFLPSFFHL